MKWQTKLSINQVTAVKKTNSEKSIASLKTTRLKKHPLYIQFFILPYEQTIGSLLRTLTILNGCVYSSSKSVY